MEDEFINAIDKYLQPKSNEELLAIIQQLQNADNKTTDAFLDALTPEDVGMNIKDPYNYILRY